MPRLIFTDEAKQDLIAIRHYTHETWGALKAKIYLSELRDSLKRLQEQPLSGSDRSSDVSQGVRSFPYVSHMIYYRLHENDLIVLVILHRSMVPSLHIRSQH